MIARGALLISRDDAPLCVIGLITIVEFVYAGFSDIVESVGGLLMAEQCRGI